MTDAGQLTGWVVAELRGPDGELKARCETKNLITDTGDTMYASRGSGAASPGAAPTGMKLGTDTANTAAAKNGTGAALVTYLSGSDQAFDATYPSFSDSAGAGCTVTYKVTYAAGTATTASAITECVIVSDTLANATSTAANTVSRVQLSGIPSKGASDTLTVTWTHLLKGT